MLRELAPLPAEEGIDVDNIGFPDLDTLQAGMNRAVERHNMARFTPEGQARDLVVTTLRLAIEARAEGDTALAGAILAQVQPESPDNTVATVAGCIGLALGLLDDWLSAPTRRHRATSASLCVSPPDTGSVNAPRTTSSCPPARAALSAP